MTEQQKTSVSTTKLFSYALGEGAVSITMNGIANFAMLYYTLALGLGAGYAGLALGITTFWDAITDPVMGHITDNTRSRFGRRHLRWDSSLQAGWSTGPGLFPERISRLRRPSGTSR